MSGGNGRVERSCCAGRLKAIRNERKDRVAEMRRCRKFSTSVQPSAHAPAGEAMPNSAIWWRSPGRSSTGATASRPGDRVQLLHLPPCTTARKHPTHDCRGNRRKAVPDSCRRNSGLLPTTLLSSHSARFLSFRCLRYSGLDRFFLILPGVIASIPGYRDRSSHAGMREIAMAPLATSIDEAVLLQFGNQLPDLLRHSFSYLHYSGGAPFVQSIGWEKARPKVTAILSVIESCKCGFLQISGGSAARARQGQHSATGFTDADSMGGEPSEEVDVKRGGGRLRSSSSEAQ